MRFIKALGMLFLLTCGFAHADPLELGTVEVTQEFQGVSIKLPIDSTLDVQTTEKSLSLAVALDVNMADIQSKFQSIVGSFQLPTDNCAGYHENIVGKLENASLNVNGSQAVINARAHVAVWMCEKGVPGTGTTMEWKLKCKKLFGKKFCTKVPVRVTIKPGPDIKTKVAEDDVSAKVELLVSSPDGKSVELTPKNVDISLHNDLTKFLNNIAAMFNLGLNNVARDKVGSLVNAGLLKRALPEEILQYNPKIATLSFYTRPDGALGLKVNVTSELSGEQLTKFIKDALLPEGATPAGPAQGITTAP